MKARAYDYDELSSTQLVALFGMLKNREIEDQIDYVIVPSLRSGSFDYRVRDSGYINGSITNYFSISSAYTTALMKETGAFDFLKANSIDLFIVGEISKIVLLQ